MDADKFKSLLSEPTETGCIEWTGYRMKSGHGRLRIDGEKILAHRYAWSLEHGDIPECSTHYGTKVICHRCDNPSCCNVDHLFIGTQADNIKDMDEKGRRSINIPPIKKGSESPSAKLTEIDVIEIRRLRAEHVPLRQFLL